MKRVRSLPSMAAVLGLAALAVGLTSATRAVALPADCSQSLVTVTCTYTSGSNVFVVPKGVSSVHVIAVGGSGANSVGAPGGLGARVSGDLPVTAGDTLFAVVGGNGTAGGGGSGGGGEAAAGAGGGGGASDVRTSQADQATRLIVAAGGGGAGRPGNAVGGNGGDAGAPGSQGVNAPDGTATGGAGGGAATGAAGGAGGAGGGANGGGTGSGPGLDGCNGDDGQVGAGGAGASQGATACYAGGGGGGGGLYGGGGGGGAGDGNETAGGGGGGGGSSLVPPGGRFAIDGTATPEIEISYTAPDAVTPSQLDFGSVPIGSFAVSKIVALSDTGTAPILVGSIAMNGANPGDFLILSDACSGTTLAPGDSCAVKIRFAPTATGSRSATLSFADDADDSPQSAALSGIGTTLGDLKVAISGPSSAPTGSQATYLVNVTNAGPSQALNVVMTAQVPTGTKFVGVNASQGSCTRPAAGSTSATISCSLGDLASGAAAIDSVALRVTVAKGSTVATVAQAYSTARDATPATPDPNLGNNVASLITTITKK